MLAMQAYKKPATFQHYAKDCRAATNLPNGKPPFKIEYFNYGNIVLPPKPRTRRPTTRQQIKFNSALGQIFFLTAKIRNLSPPPSMFNLS